jgi:hypothetical protein
MKCGVCAVWCKYIVKRWEIIEIMAGKANFAFLSLCPVCDSAEKPMSLLPGCFEGGDEQMSAVT